MPAILAGCGASCTSRAADTSEVTAPNHQEAADHDFSPSVGTSTHQYTLIPSSLLPHLLIQRHSHASADMKEDLFTGGCKVRHSHVLGKGTGQPSQVARMGAQLNLGEGGGGTLHHMTHTDRQTDTHEPAVWGADCTSQPSPETKCSNAGLPCVLVRMECTSS